VQLRRGQPVTSLHYGNQLAEMSAVSSIDSVGDSDDVALAETVTSLFKTELIRGPRPWRSLDDVELPTLTLVTQFNAVRLHGPLGTAPPTEHETGRCPQSTDASQWVGKQYLEPQPNPEAGQHMLNEVVSMRAWQETSAR
jgi:putative transposase